MTNDPAIEDGLILLRQIFDLAKNQDQANFTYTSKDDATVLEKGTIDLENVLSGIETKVSDRGLNQPQSISLSFQHRAPNGKIMEGDVPVSEKHVDDLAGFKKLTTAIEYRRQSFGLC